MNRENYGDHNGKTVEKITLKNGGITAKLINYGARLTELWVPDASGELADIVLGFDDLDSYVATDTFFGATCGRYGNRIKGGKFTLGGQDFQVDMNEGNNHLHGGKEGFDTKVWRIETLSDTSVTFSLISEDGEMGFPGRCEITSVYRLTDKGQLKIEMSATTNKTTLMNMVNHSYFNLAGCGSGDVLSQQIILHSDFYTPIDDELMTTGEVLQVADTPYDFRELTDIGRNIDELDAIGAGVFTEGGGYDHNWCLRETGHDMRLCADVLEPKSGRRMHVETTEPGAQFYTGGYLNDSIISKDGKKLCKYAGFTLETQKFPDAPNFAHFPHCILHAGETYLQKMVFTFTTDSN